GSGTRSTFLADIGLASPGSCVQVAEENDPTAIAAQTHPADAIEPMSGARLNLFLGDPGTGGTNHVGPYFHDPSCGPAAAGTPTSGPCTASNSVLAPAVKLVTTGTPSDSNPIYDHSR